MARIRAAALLAACASFLVAAGAAIAALPGAPTNVVAINGNARASLHFAPPASDGGQKITGYTVTATPGGASQSGIALPIVVTGLANNTTYTFTVHATNASGNGAESAASNPVKPTGSTIQPKISAQQTFTLALDENGQVYAWGSDSDGQLGQGRSIHQTTPIQVGGLPPITQVSVFSHVLAIDQAGQLWSWGDPCAGALGPREHGNTFRPARVLGTGSVAKALAGYCRSYLLKPDNTVWEVGNVQPGIRQIAGFTGIIDIASHGQHVLALKSNQTVWAYGSNNQGQLGQGNTNATSSVVQVPGLPAGVAVKALAASLSGSLAVLQDGRIFFWGAYSFAQPAVTTPTQLTGLPVGVSAVAAALDADVIVAAGSDGSVWQWQGSLTSATKVGGFSGVKKVKYFGNGANIFALGDAGLAVSGVNTAGQLGVGNTNPTGGVVSVPGFTSSTLQVETGGFEAAVLAVKADGTLWMWGANSAGQIGDGVPIGSSTPLAVPIPATIKSISATDRTAFALDTSGQVWGWGDWSGLASGEVSRSTPAIVSQHTLAGSTVTAFAATGRTTWASLRSDGTVWLDGTQHPELTNIVGIEAGGAAGFFRRNDGVLLAAGDNTFGQVGDGTTTYRSGAVPVLGITGTIDKVAAGGYRVAALTSDGRVYTWGSEIGGLDLTGGTRKPVLVPGLTDAVDIAVSPNGGLARRANGSLVAWGATSLQDSPTTNPTIPFTVVFSQPFNAFALSESNAYLVGTTGVVWGAGLAPAQQMDNSVGDGTYVYRGRPVVVMAHAGSGSLDANNWFLDLQPHSAETIPAAYVPTGLGTAVQFGGGDSGLGLAGSVKYKSADLGKNVNNYVLALVPPAFFSEVAAAPGTSAPPQLAAKAAKSDGFVLAHLTPSGWSDVNGQLIAYSQGVAGAAGGASNILNGVKPTTIPGARFCIGYGETADSMLSSRTLREVLLIDGSSTTTSGVPCVISGVYVSGPATSVQSSPVTFAASVVGLSPTGSVQFTDSGFALGGPLTIAQSNPAVGTASITTSSLTVGTHPIGARYGGDAQNSAIATETPKIHVVSAPLAQTQVALEGPVSSPFGSEVAFIATVTGNQAGGTVQFRDGGAALGAAVAVVGGIATLRTSSLAVGAHSIDAAYSGDAQNTAGTSAARGHVVTSIPPANVALASSANPAPSGAPIAITVTVTGNAPTGNVTLRVGAASVGTKSLGGGTAIFTLAPLVPGTHSLYADYLGDASNTQATSPAFYQQVALPPPPIVGLSVSRAGTGSGAVTSSPAGIDCGATCSANFLGGLVVTLTPAAANGSTFAGWSGDCAGGGSCSLALGAPRAASARFDLTGTGVSVAPAGTLAFGGQSINTTSPAQAATFTNNSGATIAVGAIASSSGFAATHDCASVANNASCTVSVTFTPSAEGNVAASLVLSYVQGGVAHASAIPVSGTGERSLVTHYYRSILRRAPDAAGKSFWEAEAARLQSIGADINEAWFAMAQFFYFSAEYTSFNRDNAGFVTDLYTTFFNRAPDAGGLPFWVGQIDSGMPREVVLTSFMFSNEFVTFAQGIFGATAARAEVNVVMDFYRGLLARTPDASGYDYWVGQFRLAQCAGAGSVYAQVESISSQFAGGSEYTGKNRANAQYVGDLYNAFLRRGGDLGGVGYWISTLSTQSRDFVRGQFIASAEFQARVANIVNQGCLP